MDISSFDIARFVHVISVITGFGAVIVIDSFGLAWFFKKASVRLLNQVANVTEKLIWLGWFGAVLSGSFMVYKMGGLSAIGDLTALKVFLVALLGLNGVNLHYIKKKLERSGENIPLSLMLRVGVASFVSQVGWWGALIIGFLSSHAY